MKTLSRSANITDQICEQIQEAILSGQLLAGSLHSVIEFSHEFSVSRTPVREAVLRLADAGLVTIERNRGFRIRSTGVDDIRRVFELRVLLEIPAASAAAIRGGQKLQVDLQKALDGMNRAAQKDDKLSGILHHRAFHAAIDATLQNRRISDLLASIRDEIQDNGSSGPGLQNPAQLVFRHEPLASAIFSGNPESASAEMRNHLLLSASSSVKRLAPSETDADPREWLKDLLLPYPDFSKVDQGGWAPEPNAQVASDPGPKR